MQDVYACVAYELTRGCLKPGEENVHFITYLQLWCAHSSRTGVTLVRSTTAKINHGRGQLRSSELHTGTNQGGEDNHGKTKLSFSTVVELAASAAAAGEPLRQHEGKGSLFASS